MVLNSSFKQYHRVHYILAYLIRIINVYHVSLLPQKHSEPIDTLNVRDLLGCVDDPYDEDQDEQTTHSTNETPKPTRFFQNRPNNSPPLSKKTLKKLCNRVPKNQLQIPSFINFVSLDVEGQDLKVLKSFPFDLITVGAFVLEMTSAAYEQHQILTEHGYHPVAVTNKGVDTFYIHESTKYDLELNKKDLREHPAGSHGC